MDVPFSMHGQLQQGGINPWIPQGSCGAVNGMLIGLMDLMSTSSNKLPFNDLIIFQA